MSKIYFIIALVVIIAGVYLFMGNKNQTQSPQIPPTQETPQQQPTTPPETQGISPTETSEVTSEKMVVSYTDNGFDPSSVTVKRGTTVTFINQSSKKMWVASAPHPQHTDLPGFDELQGVDNGGTYEYTLTKIGTWRFHNHLAPSNFGSVTIEE